MSNSSSVVQIASARSTRAAAISVRTASIRSIRPGKLRWAWESTNIAAGQRSRPRSRSDGLRRARRGDLGPQDFLYLELEQAPLLVRGKANPEALRPAARRVGRGDPRHLAGDRVLLRVVGQRQQQVHIRSE